MAHSKEQDERQSICIMLVHTGLDSVPAVLDMDTS